MFLFKTEKEKKMFQQLLYVIDMGTHTQPAKRIEKQFH